MSLFESYDLADEHGIVFKSIALVCTEITEFNWDNWTKIKIDYVWSISMHSLDSSGIRLVALTD